MANDKKSLRDQYKESEQNAFIREVREDYQKERILKFWLKYKYPVLTALLLPILIVSVISWHTAHIEKVSREEADLFQDILALPENEKLPAILDFAKTAKYAYRDIAYESAYSIQIEKGDAQAAIATIQDAISNATAAEFKNAAIIKLALMPEFADTNEKIKLLEDIGKKEPLYFSARLTLALVYMRGNLDNKAFDTLAELSANNKAPAEIRTQAAQIASFIKTKRMM